MSRHLRPLSADRHQMHQKPARVQAEFIKHLEAINVRAAAASLVTAGYSQGVHSRSYSHSNPLSSRHSGNLYTVSIKGAHFHLEQIQNIISGAKYSETRAKDASS